MSKSVSAELVIAAAPERLWSMVADVTRMGEWSPESTGGEWVQGVGPEVGARFRGRNKRGWSSWTTTCEVSAAEPGRVFAFRTLGRGGNVDTEWTYLFEPADDGTRVTESATLRKPLTPLARLLTLLTIGVRHREEDLRAGMARTLERLAAAASPAPLP